MRFWDTSAIVPLLMDEVRTDEMLALLQDDRKIVTSFITPVEVISAVWRRLHSGLLSAEKRAAAEATFADLSANWADIGEPEHVIETAIDLLSRHALRAGDALQLASAIVGARTANRVSADLPFVTLDTDLAQAARAEGFPVLP